MRDDVGPGAVGEGGGNVSRGGRYTISGEDLTAGRYTISLTTRNREAQRASV